MPAMMTPLVLSAQKVGSLSRQRKSPRMPTAASAANRIQMG